MSRSKQEDQYSDEEATRRMNDALRRTLNTPHKALKRFIGKSTQSPSPAGRKLKPRDRAKP